MSRFKFENILLCFLALFLSYLLVTLFNLSFNILQWPDYWYGIWAILYYLMKIHFYVKTIYMNSWSEDMLERIKCLK